jgi:hypothetical protein
VSSDLATLMALRVQGIATVERASVALAVDQTTGRERLRDLVARDLAAERTGRLAGFALTTAGAEHVDKLLAEEGLRTSETLRECYDRFTTVDPGVKKVCSRSQIEGPDAALDELLSLHDRAKVCVRKVVACAPRFAPYQARLEACVERLIEGDNTAFTKPMAESYHQVWWELHHDLLLTLGLEREE